MGVALGALWMLLAGHAASATDPVELGETYVTDVSDVLSDGEEAEANERLAETFSNTGIDLYVVFVDEFTNPTDRIAWANLTADYNGLGESQYLLAVSTEGRQYFISSLAGGPLSDSQVGDVEEALLLELRNDDWQGAILAAADQIESEQGESGRTGAIVIGGGIAALGVGGAAFGISRAVKKRRARSSEEDAIEDLERDAGAALVATDNAVKSSAQEVEFARAQFGDGAVADFAAALETANAQLLEAFALQQRLDDAEPETPEQQRELLEKIIELCESVDATLDAQVDSFERLRDIEKNAPAALAAVSERREQAAAQAPKVQAELDRLATIYAAETLATVAQNPQESAALLTAAAERESAASAALAGAASGEAGADDEASGNAVDSGSAAIAIRETEAAVAQVESLNNAVLTLGAQLREVETACNALLTDIEGDLASARALPDADGKVASAVEATQAQLTQARTDLTGAERRPDRALQALEAANTSIDGVIAAARETERVKKLVDANLAQALEQIQQAESFIDARRGSIGATARTRISEARAAYAQAEATKQTDPQAAFAHAQRAVSFAASAVSEARHDANASYGGFAGSSSGGNSDLLGGLLGGLIGSNLGSGGFGGSGGGYRSRSGRSRGGSRSSGGSRRRSGGGRF